MSRKEDDFIQVPAKYIDRVIGNYNPVTIITTRNEQNLTNAAPYAMCMEVCHRPAMFVLSVRNVKDTYRNVKDHGEFVINVPGKELLGKLMITAVRYPPEVSEMVKAGLRELPGIVVNAARIRECKLHFECQVEWIHPAGNHFVILGKVVSVTAHKEILTEAYRVKFDELKPVHYVGRGTRKFFGVGEMITVKK
ncbi:flavin reductase family protein [Thermodesulfobacteriota bacterium]